MTQTRSLVLMALSGLAVIGLVSPASADIVTVTFSGPIHFSADPRGVFGCTTSCSSVDDPYAGYVLTATYTFDTSQGRTEDTNTSKIAQGGSSFPPSGDPSVSPATPLIGFATVTISYPFATPYHMSGSYYADLGITTSNEVPGAKPYTFDADVLDAVGDEIDSELESSDIPFSITTPFGPTDFGVAGATTFLFDCSGGQNTCLGQIGADMTVSLTSDSLSPVPELSTWTMMAVGFLGLGFVGYRQAKPISFA